MKLRKRMLILATIMILCVLTIGCSNKKDGTTELNISAAASLREIMEELEVEYKKINENIDLVVNFGGSGSLQQQIEQGAPCDLFISAGLAQMDNLKDGGYLEDNTYRELVRNDLVLIAPEDSKITNTQDLLNNDIKHIGMGEPISVPAGKYADEVLNSLNIKDALNNKLVFAKDVKEVLAWTKSKNADAGFVYYSDAINNDKIKIIEEKLEGYHSPIIYPVGIIKDNKNTEEAKKFEEFLLGEDAQMIFAKYGYKSIR